MIKFASLFTVLSVIPPPHPLQILAPSFIISVALFTRIRPLDDDCVLFSFFPPSMVARLIVTLQPVISSIELFAVKFSPVLIVMPSPNTMSSVISTARLPVTMIVPSSPASSIALFIL